MPVLNERIHHNFASAIDAEGFVHLDLELELELEMGVEVGAVADGKTTSYSGFPEDWTKGNNHHVTCKIATALPEKPAPVMESAPRAASPPRAPSPPAQCGQRALHPAPAPRRPASPPSSRSTSICHVRAAELFPKRLLEADDPAMAVPFAPICGEAVQYLSRTQDGVLAMSNYRLYHRIGQAAAAIIPLRLVESADVREIFFLHIMCKDARSFKCSFVSGEQCNEWQRRIEAALQPPASLEGLFAFTFRAWAAEPEGAEVTRRLAAPLPADPNQDFRKEVTRLQFDLHGAWRVSSANADFRLCASYPPLLLVPACVTDDALETVAKFRSSRRIPAIVWRHKGNGAVIARCSQPEVGWLGWRSNEDEQLLAALSVACQFDRGPVSAQLMGAVREPARKVLIVDARSYASAVTNRARGGGCECPQYYPCAEIQFMCLPNIHSVRKSAQALRALAAESPDHANWHSVLERSLWLQSVGGLLKAASLVARAVHVAGRPTLVHCSDGWDRTPQIVATAQLLLDPYYRTCEGFRVLVEREWLDFGHKFADRCGHTVGTEDLNERCPVFLQWLDCVHQIQVQYPCSFEFSQAYLIKLAHHAYSCLFGTFLCNSRRERTAQRVAERTFSVWKFLMEPEYRNHLYEPNGDEVLYPAHSSRALVVWASMYLGAAPDIPAPLQPPPEPAPQPAEGPPHSPNPNSSPGVMTKTRSYGDLLALSEHGSTLHRRSSDPSITVDPMKLSTLSISGANTTDGPLNNNDSGDRQLIDVYSDDSVDSDLVLGSQLADDQEDKNQDPSAVNQTSYVQKQNILNTSCPESLINTTVPRQIVNGYSKVNGNVPILNNGVSADNSDGVTRTDSNSNTRTDDFEVDLINGRSESNGVYENGNTSILIEERLLEDSPDQIDGINEAGDYIEQAIDTIADSPQQDYEERPARIVTRESSVTFKSSSAQFSLSPTEEIPVFVENNLSDSGELSGRIRNESLTWRSISECSQQTDSSSGCVDLGAELNNSGVSPSSDGIGHRNGGMRRQRLDSVQNGRLNDTAAILLETEIGNLISAESAAKRLSEQQNLATSPMSHIAGHRRQRSDGGNASGHFEYFPPLMACMNADEIQSCSDMTLCPNSPLRTYRAYSAGANMMGRWHGRSVSVPCSQDPPSAEWRGEGCRLCCCNCTPQNCKKSQQRHSGVANSRGERTGSSLDPVDGLVCPQSPVQHRLHQIIQDHKNREDVLMRELHAARVELLQRACRTARLTPDHNTENANRDSSDSSPELNAPAFEWSEQEMAIEEAYFDENFRKQASLDAYWDYQQSDPSSSSNADPALGPQASEHASMSRATSVSSSGMGSSFNNGSGVLWVPDHAVSRCTRCHTHFWLGKRKHHCRSCGRIFCAECSENTTPLPNEQLFSPVRVCHDCFASLAPPQHLADERGASSERSVSGPSPSPSQPMADKKKSPGPAHSASSDVRHLSDFCKQAAGDQKLTSSSQVTAASN